MCSSNGIFAVKVRQRDQINRVRSSSNESRSRFLLNQKHYVAVLLRKRSSSNGLMLKQYVFNNNNIIIKCRRYLNCVSVEKSIFTENMGNMSFTSNYGAHY